MTNLVIKSYFTSINTERTNDYHTVTNTSYSNTDTMSDSDGFNGPLRKRIKVEGNEDEDAETSEPPVLSASQQVLAQVQASSSTPSSKSREVRLEQNRKAARESRRRKKVMVEELQRSVIFFSRANAFLKQQNDEYTRMLAQAQAAISQMSNGAAPQAQTDKPIESNEEIQPVQQLPPQTAPIQQNVVTEANSNAPLAASPISAEQAAQAQAVARAAAQQFAPQFAAMFGASSNPAQNSPTGPSPTTPLQVAAANFQQVAAAQLANPQLLGTYQTAFPATGPYADAFQNALFQQQAAVAATTGQQNFNIPMNFGGPFQQAALAQHFSQNMSTGGANFPNNFMNVQGGQAQPNVTQSNAPSTASAEPATAST